MDHHRNWLTFKLVILFFVKQNNNHLVIYQLIWIDNTPVKFSLRLIHLIEHIWLNPPQENGGMKLGKISRDFKISLMPVWAYPNRGFNISHFLFWLGGGGGAIGFFPLGEWGCPTLAKSLFIPPPIRKSPPSRLSS